MNIKKLYHYCACALFPAITWLPTTVVQAQSAEGAAIEEILVSATRRQESLQDVPVAVTALSAEALDRAGVIDLRSLDTLVTSFNMQTSQTETEGVVLRVRGVGTTGNNIGLESAVGIFLDDVYLSRPGVALGDLMDVEQVEVLRGPQGTLFGRNTSAGAISIRTKRPNLNENEFFANLTAGNYDAQNLQAGISGPIVEDTLGYRLSLARRVQDGYMNSTSGGESYTRDRYSLRGQLLWNISDTMDLRIIGDFAETEEQCCDAVVLLETQARAAGSYVAAGLPADGGVRQFGDGALDDIISNAAQFENGFDQAGLSAELNWELSENTDLTWLSSFRQYDTYTEQYDYVDIDIYRVDPPAANGIEAGFDIDTWTSELRLTGDSGRLSWMVGAYISDEDIHNRGGLGIGNDFTANMDAMLWRFAFGPVLSAAP
ncbi:MAG: TonB-dependent receptor, partial [Gammaproteobacteria bacterium]|nr:TonB-dependent receptor [Gammaproteobacteria bacterium]